MKNIKNIIIGAIFLIYSAGAFGLENFTTKVKPVELDIELFWKCRPWKDNKLMTIDGKGRFATVEFSVDKKGHDKAKVVPLCQYPKRDDITNHFWVFPESETVCVWSKLMMHVYNNKTKKKNSFVPVLSWKGFFNKAFELSNKDLYMHFYYFTDNSDFNERHMYVSYDQKKKDVDDDDFGDLQREDLLIQLEPYGRDFLACEVDYKDYSCEYFYYNIDSKERKSDDFTRKLTELFSDSLYEVYINREERFLISNIKKKIDNRKQQENVLMTWDEGNRNFKIIPFDHLVPSGKKLKFPFTPVSDDRHWALGIITGYKDPQNQCRTFFKYAFINFDKKYPANISPLILIDDHHINGHPEGDLWEYGTFFEHPVYGTCFIYSYTNHSGIKKTYLYKMSDFEKEIEEMMKEKD